MAQKGRRKKYDTEEEAKAAQTRQQREYHERKVANAGREGVTNPCKHKKVKYDGITIDIGTMDRTKLNTAYIDIRVTTTYTNELSILEKFRTNVHRAFNTWLSEQTMWDRRNRIAIMEYNKVDWNYQGKHKTIDYQYHIRRDEITNWDSTIENLMGLVTALVDEIKKTCDDTGLQLVKWCPNPGKKKD